MTYNEKLLIRNTCAILPDGMAKNVFVGISGGKISYVSKRREKGRGGIDARGLFLAPGFIDTHIHGDPFSIFRREVRHGTTSFLVAFSCMSASSRKLEVERIRHFQRSPEGKSLIGIRLEGPFISKKKAGAQDRRHILPFSKQRLNAIIDRCGGLLRMMTLAPELRESGGAIRVLRENRIIPSLGHTDGTENDARRAHKAGANHATHLFNAMNRTGVARFCRDRKEVWCEVIADGIHVDPDVLRIFFEVKPKDRSIIITDSIVASDGIKYFYRAGRVFKDREGVTLGSELTMNRAIRRLVEECGVSLVDAVRSATENPARCLGLKKKGSIKKGYDADLVLFDRNFDVKMTMIGGRIVYKGN